MKKADIVLILYDPDSDESLKRFYSYLDDCETVKIKVKIAIKYANGKANIDCSYFEGKDPDESKWVLKNEQYERVDDQKKFEKAKEGLSEAIAKIMQEVF